MTNKMFVLFFSLLTMASCVGIAGIPSSENLAVNASNWDFMVVLVKDFPVSENTSFDTYNVNSDTTNYSSKFANKVLSNVQVRKLGLEKWLQNNSVVSVNYELPYSKDFRTFVFTCQEGEMELKTKMVTFDRDFNKIDELQVAYDEIAESWLQTKSEFSQSKIEVKEYNESTGKVEVTISVYRIDEKGKFVAISKS